MRLAAAALVLIAAVPLFAATAKQVSPEAKGGKAKEPAVSIDVKDEDIHAILRAMQKQCGVKNLILDPGVEGKGTFLFHSVPCHTAFDVVFRTMGLEPVFYPNSVITAGLRRH